MIQFENLKIAKPEQKNKLMQLQTLVTEAKRNVEANFWEDPNIVSIGVGFKLRNNQLLKDDQGDELVCIKFTVCEKAAAEVLGTNGFMRSELIPEVIEYRGIRILTDVEERNYEPHYTLVAAQNANSNERTKRQNTISPGISISHYRGTAGTLGAIVYDNATYQPYILSNWHVLSGPTGKIGDAIVQPGPYDDNRLGENHVGNLVRSFLGMAGDGALCSIKGRNFVENIIGLGTKPLRMGKPDLGDKVIKSGRTTAITQGIVSQVAMTTRMNYSGLAGTTTVSSFEIVPDKGGAANYEISDGGDSGALWLINDGARDVAVGLHFAGEVGSYAREFALSCYLDKVLEKLEAHIPVPNISGGAQALIAAAGYDPDFITSVKLPDVSKIKQVLTFKNQREAKYGHFSIILHSKRKMPILTACNIDGREMNINHMKSVPRPSWKTDENVGADNQLTNRNFYSKTRSTFDRGHMVRRFDPMWGDDALSAHDDTFNFTNVIPQYHSFNAGIWNDLEDWILFDADTKDTKVNVFTGPVFMPGDEVHAEIAIPYYFWKVIVRYKESKQKLAAIGFIMGSGDEIFAGESVKERKRISIIPDDKVAPYQVPIKLIESYTKIDFGDLKKCDISNTSYFHAEEINSFKPIRIKSDLLM